MHRLGEVSGFYFFPGAGLGPDATMQQKRAAMDQYRQKLAANPSGILIYHPAGATPMMAGQLYWNWNGFPGTYTAAYMMTGLVGFICVGLVAAVVMKQRVPATTAAAA